MYYLENLRFIPSDKAVRMLVDLLNIYGKDERRLQMLVKIEAMSAKRANREQQFIDKRRRMAVCFFNCLIADRPLEELF